MNVFIGGAWPYANGSLHVGHLAALLPGDVIARYHRKKGDKVLYVSGSDCHGTPISVRAQKEGIEPYEITDKYHSEFKDCFERLGFSYDLYWRTDDDFHKSRVKDIINVLYSRGYIYEKEIEQVYCQKCQLFLPDRYVEGICPICGQQANGDQCDNCQSLLEPTDLIERKCKSCGSSPVVKPSKQLYFALSSLEEELRDYVNQYRDQWRVNAVNSATRYITDGLRDRAITRDLPWGVDVPIHGYEDKKIYVWIDAVLGYLTTSILLGGKQDFNYLEYWNEETISYYVHGKDNIPFHTVILPALLKAIDIDSLPQRILSSEYVTIEGKKISTSNNWAIWVKDLISKYNPDVIRYILLANGPEKRDADFSYRELITLNNADLVGSYGNLINRTLVFIKKSYDGEIKKVILNKELSNTINSLYEEVGHHIEEGKFKKALNIIFNQIRWSNKYFDSNKPWLVIKDDSKTCYNILYNCVYSIANIANLLEPFLPQSSKEVREILSLEDEAWHPIDVPDSKLGELQVLFTRLDIDNL